MSLRILLSICSLYITSVLYAGKIESAFEALEKYDYFRAKELFEKKMDKYPSASAFGLATIFFRNDNPFHSLDSAYRYIRISHDTYPDLKERKREKWTKYGFTQDAILMLRQDISTRLYQLALQKNSVQALTAFIAQNAWANELPEAIHKRDSMAFTDASVPGSSAQFSAFLENYPLSEYRQQAQEDFYLAQYREQTDQGRLLDYIAFLRNFPDNPHTADAENRIYEIVTQPNTIRAYKQFIEAYPDNHNVDNAWRKLYQLYMYDYSDERIAQFEAEYPQYPFKDDLEKDLDLMTLRLLPYKSGTRYGLMNTAGVRYTGPDYEYIGFFREGLALAAKNGKYGYIDKNNETVIPFLYDSGTDFEDGRAIVELDGKTGIIDRTGQEVLPIRFEDIGSFSETLIYGKKDSLYAYYDRFGKQRIPERFTEAFAFNKKRAKVYIDDRQTYIDIYGNYLFPPEYESLEVFNDSLYVFGEEDLYGIISKRGYIVFPAVFEEVGQLVGNRALIVQDGLIGYLDEKAHLAVEPAFETFPNFVEFGTFRDGMAVVRQKGKYGAIDRNGKFSIPAIYTSMGELSELIAVSKGKEFGFVDRKNNLKIPMTYEYAESFNDGFAIVQQLAQLGVINSSNILVIPTKYSEISRLNKNMFVVNSGARQGLYSTNGELLTAVVYQSVRQIDDNFVLLATPDALSYYYIPEKRIIEVKRDE